MVRPASAEAGYGKGGHAHHERIEMKINRPFILSLVEGWMRKT